MTVAAKTTCGYMIGVRKPISCLCVDGFAVGSSKDNEDVRA